MTFDNGGALEALKIGDATLYLGDCSQVLPTLALDRDDTACVADPPYKFETSGGGKLRKARGYVDEIEASGLADGFDVAIIDGPGSTPDDPKPWAASAVIFCHDDQGPDLWAAMRKRWRRAVACAWVKTNPIPVANKHYKPDLELYFRAGLDVCDADFSEGMYLHGCDKGAHPDGALSDRSRFWKGAVGKSEFNHPTVKPVALMEKILRNVRANVIVDPFMGTGTTGVAALRLGKRFIGIERNPDFFEIARRRLSQAVLWNAPCTALSAPHADEPAIKGKQERLF